MKLNFLIKKVLDDTKVKDLLENNYFLASCFCMPKLSDKKNVSVGNWTFHFYNSDIGKVVSVTTENDGIKCSEKEDAVKPMKELSKHEYVDPSKTVLKLIKKVNPRIESIMLTFQNKKIKGKIVTVWSVVFVLTTLNVLSFDVNAKTGKLLHSGKDSFIRRVSRAS